MYVNVPKLIQVVAELQRVIMQAIHIEKTGKELKTAAMRM